MKKLLSLALAIVIALSMAACGGGNSVSTGTTSAPAASDSEASGPKASGTITVYGWGSGSELEAHKQIVEDFNALNTGVKANLEIVPSTEYSTKLKAMLAAGTAPDVIMTGVDDNHFYYLNNNFEDLSPYIERDSFDLEGIFTPGATDGYVYSDGARWGLPFVANTMVIAYNKEYFDKYGVEYPTGDWDWNEFREVCEKLTSGEGASKEYGMTYHWATTALAHYSAGGQLFDISTSPAKMMANDPLVIEGVKMYTDLIKDGYYPDNAAVQNMPSETRFFSGKCGMIFFFPWDIAHFSESLNGVFEWDIVSLPKDATGTSTTLQWNTGYAMNADSKNKDAAWEFIKYACGSEAAAEVITNCGMPVVQTVAANWGEGLIPNTEISRQLFVDVMATSKQTILGGSFNEIGDLYSTAWNDIVYNGADVTERMEQLQEEAEPVLARLTAEK